jgi:hypothetical protein
LVLGFGLAVSASATAQNLPAAFGGPELTATLRAERCETTYDDAKESAMVYDLGANVLLVDIPCRYESEREPNHRSLLFLTDDKGGRPSRVSLEHWSSQAFAPVQVVPGLEVDERRKLVLSSQHRSANKDCGSIGRWRWNGQAFEMRDYWVKPVCDGQPFDPSARGIEQFRVFPKKRG